MIRRDATTIAQALLAVALLCLALALSECAPSAPCVTDAQCMDY